jgi:ABC-type nitrate/sulfonate/bicarbonate transport system substrate-binding protein
MRHAAIVLGIAWASMALPASAAEKLVVGEGGQNAFSFKLLDIGIRKGLFAKQGLDVESAEFAGGTRAQQALAAGSIDLALAGGTDLAAVAKGAPTKAVAAMGGPPLDFAVTVRADGPIRTVADLRGAKIGVTTTTSLTAWLTGAVSRREGWGVDGITRVATGGSATSWALLRTKEIDGVVGDLGSALKAEKRGDGRVVMRFGEIIKDFQIFMIYARDDVIAKRPDAVRAFLRGWFDTVAWVRANKAETVPLMAQLMGLDPDIAGKLYDQLMPMFSADGRFDPAGMKGLAQALDEQYGLKESALPKLITEDYLPKR